MVTPNELLLIVNAVACALVAIVLGTFQRRGAKHNYFGALLALILIISCGSITILIICGFYKEANPFETVINVSLSIAVLQAKGNVMRIFKRE